MVLSEWGAVVADTGAVGGSHSNVVRLTAEQVAQRAVGAGAVAGEDLLAAGGFHSVAHSIDPGSPGHLSDASPADHLARHVSGNTWF